MVIWLAVSRSRLHTRTFGWNFPFPLQSLSLSLFVSCLFPSCLPAIAFHFTPFSRFLPSKTVEKTFPPTTTSSCLNLRHLSSCQRRENEKNLISFSIAVVNEGETNHSRRPRWAGRQDQLLFHSLLVFTGKRRQPITVVPWFEGQPITVAQFLNGCQTTSPFLNDGQSQRPFLTGTARQ